MQAVILAAGKGERMKPLTFHIPKPMIRVLGKNLIEHNLTQLPPEVDELIIVVGYLAEQVMNHFGEEFEGRKVTYVKQKKMLGTGHALFACRPHIRGRFLVMMSDDMYSARDIEACLSAGDNVMMVKKVHGKFSGGRIITDKEGNLLEIREGVHNTKQALVNTALYVMTPDIFTYELEPIKDGKEYGLPQTMVKMIPEHPIKTVEAQDWYQISELSDLKSAERLLRKRYKKG